jgi:endonuclease-3
VIHPLKAASEKQPFDIDAVVERLRAAVGPLPKAAMFELFEAGFTTPFEQLIACIISIRTYDEIMLPAARRFFARARTPAEVSRMTPNEIEALIRPCTFSERKARQIHALARRVRDEFGGELPCDEEVLLSFQGVGPKCANLVLGLACGQPRIGVDVHVHRVTNRWGYVSAATPEKTMLALEATLPRRYWVEINRLLVSFGKHICTGQAPRCLTCPVLKMCRQVGVGSHR